MKSITNVIVATDMSKHAAIAAKWGADVAHRIGCPLTLVTVVELSIPNWLTGKYDVNTDDEKRYEMTNQLREWFVEHTSANPDEVLVLAGHCAPQLHELAQNYIEPMIVIAKTGQSRLRKLLVGSSAQSLIALAPCVTVAVDPDYPTLIEETVPVTFATDLTESCEPALRFAAETARMYKRDLDVVHALGSSSQEQLDQGKERMLELLERNNAVLHGLTVNQVFIQDDPAHGVVDYLEKQKDSLLITGHAPVTSVGERIFGRISVKLLYGDATLIVVPATYGSNAV